MQNNGQRKRVVVIGGGFGGLRTVRALRRADVEITLLDRRNHHLFQPLLYQVATGDLSPANIASPLRYLLRKQRNCTTLLAEVVDFDLDRRQVILTDGQVPFDYLVLATGASHSYFGNPHWEQHAPGIKSIEDATEIRSRILLAFEKAEREPDPQQRQAWLTFVIVGAGPTGTELAGALSEIAHHTLRNDFRKINPREAKILLVEAGPRALHVYPEPLSQKATDALRRLQVDVRTDTLVTDIGAGYVQLKSADQQQTVPCRTAIWAAGVAASPLAKRLAAATGAELDRAGRIAVTGELSIAGHPQLMALGDTALSLDNDGKPLPGLAPVAMQQGDFAGRRIAALAAGAPFLETFQYKDRGSMAVIGRFKAIALVNGRQLSGFFAWLVWVLIHLMEITLFSNRLLVLLQWAGSFLRRNRSARLITHESMLVSDTDVVKLATDELAAEQQDRSES